jgi:hypothetical protein
MNNSFRFVAVAGIVALVGAGCPSAPTSINIPPVEKPGSGPAPVKGFGMLPSIMAVSERSAISALSPMAGAGGGVKMAESPMAPNMAVASDMMIARPIPMPPETPANVTYTVTAALPTWGTEEDVLRGKATVIPAAGLTSLAIAAGLPSQALGQNPDIQNVNISWKDADGFTWSFDSLGRYLSFWKDNGGVRIMADTGATEPSEPSKQPMLDDAEAIRIADDFLTRKGFGAIPHGPAEVEKPWGYGIEPALGMPCPEPVPYMMEESSAGASGGGVAGQTVGVGTVAPAVVAPDTVAPNVKMIAPCGWYSQQVTVSYTARMNGKDVRDASGWPQRAMSVQIDLATKTVMGGNMWLGMQTEASRYPLLSSEEAAKRLAAGGRNPIYPWYGGDVKNITVTISSVSLAWMRYDAWSEGKNETYFVPALAAEGTVSYDGKQQDAYRTIVPLVADDAFGENVDIYPKPMPLDATVESKPQQ